MVEDSPEGAERGAEKPKGNSRVISGQDNGSCTKPNNSKIQKAKSDIGHRETSK